MRLNNELVVLDLEATSNQEVADERPAIQTNNFIIEIGAAFLDRDLKLIDTFQRLVRPEEPITAFITEITSITPEMCEGQPLWREIASEFEAWVAHHCDNIKRVRLSAWGNYFDMTLLRRAYARYDRPFPFSGTCFDAKTLAMAWMALSGRRTDKLGVETAERADGQDLFYGRSRLAADRAPRSPLMPRWINRAAVVVRPGRPYLEWASRLPDPEPDHMKAFEKRVSVYLVGEDPHGEEDTAPLERYFKDIFEEELAAWWTDRAAWPKHRTLELFLKWFDITCESIVTDLEPGQIEHEDL